MYVDCVRTGEIHLADAIQRKMQPIVWIELATNSAIDMIKLNNQQNCTI